MRDVDAWAVQDALGRRGSAASGRVAFFGNGDTPWSHMAQPPFSTIDWNLEETADLACGIVGTIADGRKHRSPVVRMVTPRLVLRGNARR
jgi:DNA-binding LacI/PurR family transcriptional regulator